MAHLYMSLSGDRLSQLHTSPVDVPPRLTSVPPSTCPDGGEFIAELTEFLQETLNVQVFRATITSRQDPAFRLQAVCKIASCNETVSAVKREAGFYQHQLRHLQGQYVPHLFGLFIGSSTWREIAILVTSDEGRQLGKPLYTLPLQFRKRVYRGLRRIHQAGIAQGDFGEHNIVVRKRPDGSYWPTIVDFNNAYEHECIVHGKKTQIYGSPIPERDVCTELFSAGCEGSIDIWKPATVPFGKFVIPADAATDVGSALQSASDIIRAQNLSPDYSRRAAEGAVAIWHRWYDQRVKWDRSPQSVE